MPAFSIRGVSRRRMQAGPDGVVRPATVLREVSGEIAPASICLIMGPSGSGKSTLLRLLNRLDDPDEGEIRLDDVPLPQLPVLGLRRRVVLVSQQPAPFAGTVADNVSYGLRLQGIAPAETASRTREALGEAGLSPDLLPRPADQLSVGQQQRVCLARALALRPEALLLDEPTASLDPTSASTILDLIGCLRRELGLTIIYVTHRIAEARRLGGTAIVLVDGSVEETGDTEAVLARPKSEKVQAFLRGDMAPAAAEAAE